MAVQVAILLDAVAVTDRGAAPRPWSELVATTEVPEAMLMQFSKFASRHPFVVQKPLLGRCNHRTRPRDVYLVHYPLSQ